MASKIKSHVFYVAVTPYTVEDSSADEFNELCVRVAYDDSRKYFYVDLHPGWRSDFGHGCILMGPDDPLTGPKYVKFKDSPKNSQKTIDEAGVSLELAKDAIAWLFDRRDWNRLYSAVRNIAVNGYSEQYKQQMEQLMKPEAEEPKAEPVMKQVDVIGLMTVLKTTGRAKLSDFATPIEEPKTEVSEPLKRWNDLKRKHPDALLLFRCGDFYECYQEDAEAVAKVCGVTLSKARGLGETDFYRMAGFPKHALDTYLPRLIRAGKRVAICDDIVTNETNKEDKDMRLNLNANKNESVNVQPAAQVSNPIEDAEAVEVKEVEVAEVQDIVPAKPTVKPKEDKAVTVPLGDHGTLVVGGVPRHEPKPEPEKPKRGKDGKFAKKSEPASKAETKPDPEAVGELAGMLTKVELVTYTTKNGDTAPRIVGFSGEDDPRWKPVNDEKKMLIEKYNKAKKGDPKAKLQSSPFGPAWLTDKETGAKSYCMTFGTKYMDVAKALCEAYNTTDRMAWHKAEDAVRALKKSIAEGYKAEREAKRQERAAAKAEKPAKPAEPAPAASYSSEDVADMLRKVMAGGDVPEDIKKLLKAA